MLDAIENRFVASRVSRHLISDDPLLDRVHEHVERLKLIHSVVILAVMALRRQDAELDEDIATVLDQYAGAQIGEALLELEQTLEAIDVAQALAAR